MSNRAGPSIALVGLPGLAEPLRRAGFALLCPPGDLESVTAAARQARRDGSAYVVLAAAPQPGPPGDTDDDWLTKQAAAHLVLLVCGPGLPLTRQVPARARTRTLPCTVNELMAVFGAEPVPEGEGSLTTWQALQLPADPAAGPVPAGGPTDRRWGSLWAATPTPAPAPDGDGAGAGPQTGARGGARAPDRRRAVTLADPPHPPVALGEPGPPGPGRAWWSAPDPATDLAPVVVVWAAKGGVGKSTLSLALAQHAGKGSGPSGLGKVVLVDANRGQGDIRRYLRLDGPSGLGVPTMYDAYLDGGPDGRGGPVVGPGSINAARPGPKVSFGVVLAPRDGQVHRDVVTAEAYRDAITAARRLGGLVVVDTQIVESQDGDDILTGVLVPLLLHDPGVWSLAVTDTSLPGVGNLLARLGEWAALGVPRERAMAVVNLAVPAAGLDTVGLAGRLARFAELVGCLPWDPAVHAAVQAGRAPDTVAVGRVLDGVLWRVSGLPVFAADRSGRRTGRWRALFGGR